VYTNRSSDNISQNDHGGTGKLHVEDIHTTRAGGLGTRENELRQDLTNDPPSSLSHDGSALSLREASLMRYFIQKIAPWVSEEAFAQNRDV
jgi:hypothetical protein